MKKMALHFCLLLALLVPTQFAQAGLIRNMAQSCAFGAGAFAATTYVGLMPALETGVLAVPASEIIIANAALGCGIGAVGATAATVTGWLLDSLF